MVAVEKKYPTHTWQQEMRDAFTQLDDLLSFLELEFDELANYHKAQHDFPLMVTRSYAERIRKSDPNDPLLKQVLPSPNELITATAYGTDPVGDAQASVVPGLIHKYHGRVLLVTTGACAIHCRYCFRRAFPYADNSAQRSQLDGIVHYLNQDTSIQEVIFSGGDPLTLSDKRLEEMFTQITSIKHIKRIRIHTRLPIVLPNRITNELTTLLSSLPQQLIIVVHANHPNELSPSVGLALKKISTVTPHLFNQSVLLKGVNDCTKTLIQLSNTLFNYKVTPYYLHVLDKVQGAQHFDLDSEKINTLYQGMQRHLPGYLVPKLVKEEAGKPHKTILSELR